MEKIAVLAPMPSARTTIAARVNPGLRSKMRNPKRKSPIRLRMAEPPWLLQATKRRRHDSAVSCGALCFEPPMNLILPKRHDGIDAQGATCRNGGGQKGDQ